MLQKSAIDVPRQHSVPRDNVPCIARVEHPAPETDSLASGVHVDQAIDREDVTVGPGLDHKVMKLLAGLEGGEAGAGLEEEGKSVGIGPATGGEHAAEEVEGRSGGRGVGEASDEGVP